VKPWLRPDSATGMVVWCCLLTRARPVQVRENEQNVVRSGHCKVRNQSSATKRDSLENSLVIRNQWGRQRQKRMPSQRQSSHSSRQRTLLLRRRMTSRMSGESRVAAPGCGDVTASPKKKDEPGETRIKTTNPNLWPADKEITSAGTSASSVPAAQVRPSVRHKLILEPQSSPESDC